MSAFCAGREAEIPSPGDYGVIEVAGESIVVVRSREAGLVAHYNVCRRQDWTICESVQRGMQSRVFGHGSYELGHPPVHQRKARCR